MVGGLSQTHTSLSLQPRPDGHRTGSPSLEDTAKGRPPTNSHYPYGLHVDEEGTVIVADYLNHRIVEWKRGDTSGRVLAGGNGEGNRPDQLNRPTDVLVDRETDSLIICDRRESTSDPVVAWKWHTKRRNDHRQHRLLWIGHGRRGSSLRH